MLDPSHPIKSRPATVIGNAVEKPKPFEPVFVVANDARVIDAYLNLNEVTTRQRVIIDIKNCVK